MQVAGVEPGPVRRVPALGREREPADRDEPRAGRPIRRVGDRPGRQARASRAATALEAVRRRTP